MADVLPVVPNTGIARRLEEVAGLLTTTLGEQGPKPSSGNSSSHRTAQDFLPAAALVWEAESDESSAKDEPGSIEAKAHQEPGAD